jgi:hypothetical protein
VTVSLLCALFVACIWQIAISGTYGVNDLKEDLKGMYNKAGLKSEKINFLFTDSQIADEKFLVYMNDLLSSGNIADLFPADEKESVVNSVRLEVRPARSAVRCLRGLPMHIWMPSRARSVGLMPIFAPQSPHV